MRRMVCRLAPSLALCLLLSVSGVVVAAQEPAPPTAPALPAMVTLPDVLRLLDERSPRTIADRAELKAAEADRITAATLPNPSVSYGGVHLLSGLSTGATTQHQVIVEQPLLLFGQRQARVDSADLNLRVEQARVAETIAGRRRQVRQMFATLLSRQEQLRVLQESVADLERVDQVVRGRAQAGERSQYDVARIEIETERFRIDMLNLETDVQDAAGQLAGLLGFSGWSPRAIGSLEPATTVSGDIDALWSIAQERRPSIAAMRQRQAAARGGLVLARRERLPVPAISAGTQVTQNVNGTSGFLGISLPVPLFDRGRGPIARATAELDAQTLAVDAEMAEVRADLDRAAAVMNRRREALQRLQAGVVQRLPALRRMAEDAYREGNADVLDLLDAMRSMKDIQIANVQQMEATKLAEEDVVAIAGLDIPAGS